jgi:inosose dehydratase
VSTSVSAIRLASAPCTWGVWERTVGRDDLIPPDRMLVTVRELGYAGIELGPPGYLGDDPGEVVRTLSRYGLELVGAFAPLRIDDEDGFRDDLAFLDLTIAMLATADARGPVVLAASETQARLDATGRTDAVREAALPREAFLRAAERVERAASRALDRGVRATFHPHTGTHVESPAEVASLLEHTDPEIVKICLDTGHTIVGGGDPVELARTARDRIAHLHLKDVDPRVLDRVRARELDVDQAWEQGLFCGLGEGTVDFGAVLAELAGLDGWTVIEQDRVAVRIGDIEAVRAVELRNIELVRRARGQEG